MRSRSEIMSLVPRTNTTAELSVRKVLHRCGYRFRLHRTDLPGTPDIVLPRFFTVIFVHGCFWHRHDCSKSQIPKSNRSFWIKKFRRNRARDNKVCLELKALGWKTLIVWQCELNDEEKLSRRIRRCLGT